MEFLVVRSAIELKTYNQQTMMKQNCGSKGREKEKQQMNHKFCFDYDYLRNIC